MQQQLAQLLDDCALCRKTFVDNVALLVADDDAALNDAQVAAVLGHLRKQHEGHNSMFSKISVLIPTRHRTHLLRRLIASYRSTVSNPSLSELVFRIDDDDESTRELLVHERFRTLVGPREKGYESLPKFFNELAFAANGDVLMLGNDDVIFITPGWDAQILEVANRYPDGVFNIGVKTHNEDHFPLSIVSKRAINRLGFLYDPRIFWGDIFLRDVMGRLGRNVMLPGVEIQHEWAGHSPDQTFNEGEGARRSNWMTHHVQAVDDAEAKIKELISA